MNAIFWGFIFLFINFDLNLEGSIIHLIPSFLGYIIILRGLRELDGDSARFGQARPLAFGMMIYTSVLFALDLIGFGSLGGGVFTLVLALISTILSLMVSFRIVAGVRDVETNWGVDLATDRLETNWKFMAVGQVTACVLVLIPAINIIAILISFVFTIAFLVGFHRSRMLYNQPKPLI